MLRHPSRISSERNVKFVFVILLFTVVVFGASVLRRTEFCHPSSESLIPTVSWQIGSTNFQNSRLLWERRENQPTSRMSALPSYGDIAANDNVVLYWRDIKASNMVCSEMSVISALDTQTGEAVWHYFPEMITNQLFSINNGFIVINSYSISLFDYTGTVIWKKTWQDTNLPIRQISNFSETSDSLYFLAYGGYVYQVDEVTGNVLQTIEARDIINVIDDLMITADSALRTFSINSLEHGNELYQIPISDNIPTQHTISPSYPLVWRYSNILVFAYASTSLEGYNAETGQLIWTVNVPFYGYPALMNGTIIIYGVHGLELYDANTGLQIGFIDLVRSEAWNVASPSPYVGAPVSITTSGDVIFIRYSNTNEIIAVALGE